MNVVSPAAGGPRDQGLLFRAISHKQKGGIGPIKADESLQKLRWLFCGDELAGEEHDFGGRPESELKTKVLCALDVSLILVVVELGVHGMGRGEELRRRHRERFKVATVCLAHTKEGREPRVQRPKGDAHVDRRSAAPEQM